MRTPVVFLIFNRPHLTKLVFAEIAKAKPAKLLIVADGPRPHRPGDAEKCAATRAIVETVNWDCEVIRNYSDMNLGCGRRESSGIIWAFEQVEEAILLEDDTLPHPTFFRFCEELLDKYRDDERVMHISGNNYQLGRQRGPYSYYCSRYDHVWGWATWRRAFTHYDFDIKLWPTLRSTSWLLDILGDVVAARWWRNYFDLIFTGDRKLYDSYDGQWIFAIWAQNGLSITPNVNLVTNIGFGVDSTHTVNTIHPLNNLSTSEMVFPLQHPSCMVRDREADQFAFEQACRPKPQHERVSLYARVRRKAYSLLT